MSNTHAAAQSDYFKLPEDQNEEKYADVFRENNILHIFLHGMFPLLTVVVSTSYIF